MDDDKLHSSLGKLHAAIHGVELHVTKLEGKVDTAIQKMDDHTEDTGIHHPEGKCSDLIEHKKNHETRSIEKSHSNRWLIALIVVNAVAVCLAIYNKVN